MIQFPHTRLRRLRQNKAIRALSEESHLSVHNLVLPVFVHSEPTDQMIDAMPGIRRLCMKSLLNIAEQCVELKIPAIAIFPVIPKELKSEDAREAYNEKGFYAQCIKQVKAQFGSSLLVITDVALDPYTLSGHDGLINDQGYIINDETVAILCRQALCQAQAGADIVAPSDMMDGRIGAIRQTLEQQGYYNTMILSYAAKYASSFYGPFREAVGSADQLKNADKFSYQMNPSNAREAIVEAELDIHEGADLIMVKPGLPYLDIINELSKTFPTPVFAYQVSGEYSMLKAAAKNGWLNEQACFYESLCCLKRAGARGILTYAALDMAQYLKSL